MQRKFNSLLATAILVAPVLATVGCESGEVVTRDQGTTVSEDGKVATRTRERVRETQDGAVVKEVETQRRTVVTPAPDSSPDATQQDATKSK
ncbi:MAG TPA: hypothetical protein VGN72_00850 [Tepidisphaeraceae bacterium]|nr:hypothetical protein [Tepidisphaeraceae bacterium]